MRSLAIPFVLASLLSCGGAQPPPVEPPPRPPSEALITLMSASVFTDGSIGMTCDLRPEVVAFQTLVDESTAAQDFELLVSSGNLEGQLYGLCGLYLVAPDRFEDLIGPYTTSEERVLQAIPCMLANPKVSALVMSDNPAVVRLRYPTQSLSGWLSEHPEATRQSLVLDVVGGGFSAALLAAEGCD